MDVIQKRISEEKLNNDMFTQKELDNLLTDMTFKHVGISGLDLFIIDYSFISIVSLLQINFYLTRALKPRKYV